MPANTGTRSTRKQSKYAATKWGAAAQYEDLEVPSGQLCQVRHLGVDGLMRLGILDSFDSLLSIVQDEHVARATGKPSAAPTPGEGEVTDEQLRAFAKDPQKLLSGLAMVDKVVEAVVVQPTVRRPVAFDTDDLGQPIPSSERPLREEERDPDVVYTDMIDMEDRMFLLQFAVGGVRDLEQFREGTGEMLAALEDGDEVPESAQ